MHAHHRRSAPPLERGVSLNVLPVLIQRRRADALGGARMGCDGGAAGVG